VLVADAPGWSDASTLFVAQGAQLTVLQIPPSLLARADEVTG
jgi:hypothetical protein